jgi:iron complex transport system substrate-binding protein
MAPLILCAFVGAALAADAATKTPEPVRRIVSLAPHLTELVYTAGAGDRLVGVEIHSNFPPSARALPHIGDVSQVDFERLLALKPDLVLVWSGGTPEPVIEQLSRLGLRVHRVTIVHLADVATAVRDIGQLAGTSTIADPAARDYLDRIAALRAQRAAAAEISVFYQISEKPLYTVNRRHLITEVLELCGGRNIFANLAQLAPPVSIEAVLERDPEVIMTADGAAGDPLSVWKKWPQVRAVRLGNLYTVSADHVARATTRIVDGAQEVCGILNQARNNRRSRIIHERQNY